MKVNRILIMIAKNLHILLHKVWNFKQSWLECYVIISTSHTRNLKTSLFIILFRSYNNTEVYLKCTTYCPYGFVIAYKRDIKYPFVRTRPLGIFLLMYVSPAWQDWLLTNLLNILLGIHIIRKIFSEWRDVNYQH